MCVVERAGSGEQVASGFLVNTDCDVDLQTRSVWLQESIKELLDCASFVEVCVSLQHNGPLLTMHPSTWASYYTSFELNPRASQCNKDAAECVRAAWELLSEHAASNSKHEQMIVLSVHTYDKAECMLAAIQFLDTRFMSFKRQNVRSVYFNDPRIIKAYIRPHRKLVFWELTQQAQQNLLCVAAFTQEVYLQDLPKSWGHGLFHISGDVFSDCYFQKLSKLCYTRKEVLERVQVCGDVLFLHDSCFAADDEVVLQAARAKHTPNFFSKLCDFASRLCDFEPRLCDFAPRLCDNKEVLVSVLRQHPNVYDQDDFQDKVKPWMKTCRDVLLAARTSHENFYSDKSFWLELFGSKCHAQEYLALPKPLLQDKEFVLKLVESNAQVIGVVYHFYQLDKAFLNKCLDVNCCVAPGVRDGMYCYKRLFTPEETLQAALKQFGPSKHAALLFVQSCKHSHD